VGDHAHARDFGLAQIDRFNALHFASSDYVEVAYPTAEALAFCGDALRAIDMSAAIIAELEEVGISGVRLGAAYESRARIAIALSDSSDFERWSLRCADIYTRFDSPTLSAKHGRLLQQARANGLRAADASPHPEFINTVDGAQELTDYSRMGECIDGKERAICALTLLLEHAEASCGHLYGVVGGHLRHLASVPEQAPPAELLRQIARIIQAELAAGEDTGATAITNAGMTDPPVREATFAQGFKPVVLCSMRDGEATIAAVAAIARNAPLPNVSSQLLSRLANILLDHEDVDPLTQPD
jgi:hypothetical protein